MKFKTLVQSFVVVILSLGIIKAQSWPSFTPQNFNTPLVDNLVDHGKVADISITEKNAEGTGGNTYYYETSPTNSVGGQQPEGRQLCSRSESGKVKCRRKSASFYPAYEGSSNNAISYNGYYTPQIGNRQEYGDTGMTWEAEEGGEEGGAEGGGLGGLVGLVGLLGLKGLKGLAKLSPLILALPLLPILLPLLLLPLLPLLLFIPIPIVVTPGARGFVGGVVQFSERAFRMVPEMAAEVLQSEECVERLSCEVARVSKKLHLEGIVERFTSALSKDNKYTKKILEGVNANPTSFKSQEENVCSVHPCKAKSIFTKYFAKL